MQKTFLQKIKDSSDKFVVQLGIGTAITALLFAVAYSITYTTYTTTDDVVLSQILAGYFNTEPINWTLFISPWLTKFIAILYRLFPGVACYTLLQIAFMFVSVAAINICVIHKSVKDGRGWVRALALILLLYVTAFSWMLVRMHFYYVSALSGAAAIAVIMAGSFKGKKTVPEMLLVVAFLTVCILYSIDAAYSVFCFAALAAGYRVIAGILAGRGKRAFCIAAICVLSACSILFSCVFTYRAEKIKVNGEDYVEWDRYRVSYWDYGTVPYQDDPELYESIGWSEEFYDLTKKMYFMDERFDVDSLSKLVTKFNRLSMGSDSVSLKDTLQAGKALFDSSPVARALLFASVGLFLLVLLRFILYRDRMRWLHAAASACCAAGSFVLCLYLCFRGRFPLRAFVVIAVPCIVFLAMCFTRMFCSAAVGQTKADLPAVHSTPGKTWALRVGVIGILCCVIGVNAMLSSKYLFDPVLKEYYSQSREKESYIYYYATDRKENIYVYDWSMLPTYGAFLTMDAGALNNLFCWGGSRMYTSAYYDQLQVNGIDSLYSDAFLHDNVYLLSNSRENMLLLLSYLSKEYGANTCIITDYLDYGVVVCKFTTSTAEELAGESHLRQVSAYRGGYLYYYESPDLYYFTAP